LKEKKAAQIAFGTVFKTKLNGGNERTTIHTLLMSSSLEDYIILALIEGKV